jgi:sirohydrochlorin ferrochelatase
VPLLAGSHPRLDPLIATITAQAIVPTMLAAHLGPHPLLAGALHDRLSEVGLARTNRARGLNIAAGSDGVLVIADRGPQAVSDAGVTAVLLAARLAVPVVPASLGDPEGIGTALERLREAGATHPAIAPCLIGPETNPDELTQLSAATDAPCAAPLGTHPAVAQLVAVRYGEALARISVASH